MTILHVHVWLQITCAIPHKALKALNLQAHTFVNGGNCMALAGASLLWQSVLHLARAMQAHA